MKRCTKCGLEKDESEFSKDASRPDFLCYRCKSCHNESSRRWRDANPDKARASSRKHYAANPDKVKAASQKWRDANPDRVKAAYQKWRDGNPEVIRAKSARQARKVYEDPVAKARRMIKQSKGRAKKLGVTHTISYKDILPILSVCPVLGTPMPLSGTQSNWDMASLDRINNNMGYVPGNVAVISRRANILKRDATIKELELVLAYMKRHASQQEQQQQQQQQQAQQEQEAEPSNT